MKIVMNKILASFLLVFSLIPLASADQVGDDCNEPIEYVNFLKIELK